MPRAARGVDVRAVTAWALLGSFDWDSLVTRDAGHYEPGAFDVRAAQPRPTALAGMMSTNRFAEDSSSHPGARRTGLVAPVERCLSGAMRSACRQSGSPMLSSARAARSAGRSSASAGRAASRPAVLGRAELDIADRDAVERSIARVTPWAVINAAGYVRVDDAEGDGRRAGATT